MIMSANMPGRLTVRGLLGIALLGVIALPAWTSGQGGDKTVAADRDKQLQSLEHKLKEVLKDLEAQRKDASSVTGQYTLRPSEGNTDVKSVVLDTAKVDERDKKLQDLEAKVKSLLKEVQALRSSNTKTNTPQGVALWELTTSTPFEMSLAEVVVKPAAPTEVALTRTTYKLPAAKAEALGKFLQQHVKATVMETKVEGESLIVTTTPEVQRGIGQFIALIEGRTSQGQSKSNARWEFSRPQAK